MMKISQVIVCLFALHTLACAQGVSVTGDNGGQRTGNFIGTQTGTALTGSLTFENGANSVLFSDLLFVLLPEDPEAFPGNRYRSRFQLTHLQAVELDIPWDPQEPPELIVNIRVNGATDQSGNTGSPGIPGTLTPMK